MTAIATLDELLAHAHGLEQEAVERYEELADQTLVHLIGQERYGMSPRRALELVLAGEECASSRRAPRWGSSS